MGRKIFLSLGSPVRWPSEDYYLQELSSLGMTRKGFRAWMAAVSVPFIEVGTNRFYDYISVTMALRAMGRIGSPNFLVPGCETLKKGRSTEGCRTSIPPEEIKKNYRRYLAEVFAAKKLWNLQTPSDFKGLAEKATDRIIQMAAHLAPAKLQEQYVRKAIKQMDKEVRDDELLP